jgi:hypothetical protein
MLDSIVCLMPPCIVDLPLATSSCLPLRRSFIVPPILSFYVMKLTKFSELSVSCPRKPCLLYSQIIRPSVIICHLPLNLFNIFILKLHNVRISETAMPIHLPLGGLRGVSGEHRSYHTLRLSKATKEPRGGSGGTRPRQQPTTVHR